MHQQRQALHLLLNICTIRRTLACNFDFDYLFLKSRNKYGRLYNKVVALFSIKRPLSLSAPKIDFGKLRSWKEGFEGSPVAAGFVTAPLKPLELCNWRY